MASRKLSDLHPDVRERVDRFLDAAADEGIEVLVTCTWRSGQEQDILYAQGRTTKGRIVTNAKAGESLHNFILNGQPGSRAVDVVAIVFGKPMWSADHPLWDRLGELGEAAGLQWGGRWRNPDKPHFELKEVT